MAGTVAQREGPVIVPRLALPCPDGTATGPEVETPAYYRQINVALGRSHSKQTPRRDVVFGLEHGTMVEKQRVPLAVEPWSCGESDQSRMTDSNAIATPR